MHFSSPIFLYLLPLALIPIVIHLISTMMRRRRPFPYVKLLKATRQQQKGWKRVQDLLLALLRSSIILFLILFISGPYLSGGRFPRRVVVDVSASMEPHREEISRILSSFEGINTVFLSGRVYRSMPERFIYSLDSALLEKYRDSLTLLISDFQRSSVPDTSLFMKLQMNPPSNPSAIVNVEDMGDSLVIDIRGGDYVEVRKGDSILSVLRAKPRVILREKEYPGFIQIYLMPMDDLPFDNIFYAYGGRSSRISARVLGSGLERKLLSGIAEGIFGDTSSSGNLIMAVGHTRDVRSALSSGKRVIMFGALPEVPHRSTRNILFRGIPLDSALVFDNGLPYLITDEVFFIGIPLDDIVMHPALMEWFYSMALDFSGSEKVIYTYAGQRITFPYRVSLISPDGEVLRGTSLVISDTGYYTSVDGSIVVCSNINRSESDTSFYHVEGYSFRRQDIGWIFLLLSLFLFLLEILFIGRSH